MSFELFDPDGEIRITRGHLPHWYQPGVTYFVTFRTDDSVPADLAAAWHARRSAWLARHGIRVTDSGWKRQFDRLSEKLQNEYHATFSREFMAYLDRRMGECALRRPELARIVADTLLYFNGHRYAMGDFVVMPNHVHLLVCLLGDTDLERQCYSWKKYSAGEINAVLGQRGRFWPEESFDHLIRSPGQFEALRRYIADNPRKATLAAGNHFHYVRPADPK